MNQSPTINKSYICYLILTSSLILNNNSSLLSISWHMNKSPFQHTNNKSPLHLTHEYPFYRTYIDIVSIKNKHCRNVVRIYWWRMSIWTKRSGLLLHPFLPKLLKRSNKTNSDWPSSSALSYCSNSNPFMTVHNINYIRFLLQQHLHRLVLQQYH